MLARQNPRSFDTLRPANVAAMRLDRRWWFAIGAAVIAAVALGLSQTGLFGRSSEECLPVKDLLNFSRSQAEHIAAKTGDAEGGPGRGR